MSKELEKLHEKLHLLKLSLARSVGIGAGMNVLDVGCGQGGFTVCVAELTGRIGKVTAIDISDGKLDEMNMNLDRYKVRSRVEFVKADAAELPIFFAPESFDVAASYRFIEELKKPKQFPKILSSISNVVQRGGKVVMFELSTETTTIAEENLVRLHRDIGDDYFPSSKTIVQCLKRAGFEDVDVETMPTDVSYSGEVFLKSDLGQDRIWPEFKERIMKELWLSIAQYGMKYPKIKKYSGHKPQC
jgi:cyclopropane fatty-acyl-phospholipid synthase-like methyltransferase